MTGLGDGSRIPKDSLRIHAIGEVDELNAVLGVLLTESLPDSLKTAVLSIQHDLFDLGGELCLPGMHVMTAEQTKRLETWVEGWNAQLPPLKEFILPGGCRAAALAHQARTLCRRAERSVIHLHHQEALSDDLRRYLNRLSDLLFVLARTLNQTAGQTDTFWIKGYSAREKLVEQ